MPAAAPSSRARRGGLGRRSPDAGLDGQKGTDVPAGHAGPTIESRRPACLRRARQDLAWRAETYRGPANGPV